MSLTNSSHFLTALSPRDRLLGILFFLVVATSAVYWPVRGHDFVNFDDDILVYNNKYYHPVTPQGIRHLWKAPHELLYMPLTYTAWGCLVKAAQVTPSTVAGSHPVSELSPDLDPQIFHSFSLLLHVLNTLLAFALLRLLVKNDWAAAAGAAFFGLHPLQVESVAWIAETKGLLGGFFGLLALWLYVCHLKSKTAVSVTRVPDAGVEEGAPDAQPSTPAGASKPEPALPSAEHFSANHFSILHVLALAACACALLSKPSALCLPLIAWLLDFYLRRAPRAATISLLPWVMVALPIALMARTAQTPSKLFSPFWARPLVTLDALAFYISKIVWPVGLIPDYGRTPRFVLDHGYLYWTWLLPVTIGVLLWRHRRKWAGLGMGALISVVALVPVMGLVPFSFQYYSTVADRYLYLPMLGMSLMLAWMLTRWPQRWLIGLSAAMLLALGTLTVIQVSYWRDSETLYTRILRVNPTGWFALNNMGLILGQRGQSTQATANFREAVRLRPDLEEAYDNLGIDLYKEGKKAEAINLYLKAIELSPTSVQVYRNLATAYQSIGQDKYAILALRRATQLEPDDFATQLNLAELYLRQHRFVEAQNCLAKVQELAPNPEFFHLTVAVLLTKYNLLAAAIPHYVEALRHRPDDYKLHNDLGITLLRLNRPKQALIAFNNAVKINPNYFEAYTNMGQALKQQGEKDKARAAFNRALKINPRFAPARRALAALSP